MSEIKTADEILNKYFISTISKLTKAQKISVKLAMEEYANKFQPKVKDLPSDKEIFDYVERFYFHHSDVYIDGIKEGIKLMRDKALQNKQSDPDFL